MSLVTDRLAELLAELDNGDVTGVRLLAAREVIAMAVKKLRKVDRDIAAAEESLRDRYAMAALTGMLANSDVNVGQAQSKAMGIAFSYADAAMEARGER